MVKVYKYMKRKGGRVRLGDFLY
uniref:Uncharacterized protein n=1 Tax=Rhizophora mucronata TaxID=61149 RepID=A0A2P2IH94_RHIMU